MVSAASTAKTWWHWQNLPIALNQPKVLPLLGVLGWGWELCWGCDLGDMHTGTKEPQLLATWDMALRDEKVRRWSWAFYYKVLEVMKYHFPYATGRDNHMKTIQAHPPQAVVDIISCSMGKRLTEAYTITRHNHPLFSIIILFSKG